MITKTYSYVQEHLDDMIHKVNENCDVVIVTTKDYNAVMMSEDSYNEIMETLYLQQNPANAKHLSKSIDHLERGNVKTKSIDIAD
ncbi:type II toxin-antitoxin system Phd/YefM family antitoxin [Staphylococcus pettenkoferi]|uniref:type II toxin-antitoxin system Phd/YefM family antitoxin n=1 Tax=Staphylococcus pettenkoferi TaxID=170573 RepID=UPI00066C56BB|nr:type II toxin-antitoxin system Phd/YefM family antitoxin [Staphylococcus pettenkoferi]MDK7114699.1 type II toxin-antitoxin system Phd/YefM family antitoxin [Staphylococcus pettenkoferi]MDK7283498.1 type II toxin-antitoxin system Phd/YefM family antitoxin [Staphylococcus pettenkoferi]